MPSPAEHLRDLAWECQALAETVHKESTRLELLLAAERFERLALVREHLKADPVRSNEQRRN